MKTNSKPEWIRYIIPGGEGYLKIKKTVTGLGLHTICTEARCPNSGECFARGTATFLILGDICTRDCRYCAVNKGIPSAPDRNEPAGVAEAVKLLGLNYAVITSVTRDDLTDGGASFFAETCREITASAPGCRVELLVPDFRYSAESSLEIILNEKPHILNHNIETISEFFPRLRPSGDYSDSLNLMKIASKLGARVKSGLMIGLGETMNQIVTVMNDLLESGCEILTIGQYLRPGIEYCEVIKYYHPDEFADIKKRGLEMGFKYIISGPNVRSSYHAETIN